MGNAPLGTTFDPKQAKQIFAELDVNGDGTLEYTELKDGVYRLGIAEEWPEARLLRYIEKFDINDDGNLDFLEFTKLCKNICKRNRKKAEEEKAKSRAGQRPDPTVASFDASEAMVVNQGPSLDDLAAEAAEAEANAYAAAEAAAAAAESEAGLETDDDMKLGTKYSSKVARNIWAALDMDGTGLLPHTQVLTAIEDIGLVTGWSVDKVDKFVKRFDDNGDGVIDFIEFKTLCKAVCKENRRSIAEAAAAAEVQAHAAAESALAEAKVDDVQVTAAVEVDEEARKLGVKFSINVARGIFNKLDQDNSGQLSETELRKGIDELGIVANWSFGKLKKYIKKCDKDQNGELDWEEFETLCKGICSKNKKELAERAAAEEAIAHIAAEEAAAAVAALDDVEIPDDDTDLGTKYSSSTAELIFKKLDTEKTQSLDYEHLLLGIYDLGIVAGWGWSDQQLTDTIVSVDENEDLELDVEEFKKLCKAICKGNRAKLAVQAEEAAVVAHAAAAEAELQSTIDDVMVSGDLQPGEAGLGTKFSSKTAKEIFNKLDDDKSGHLSQAELKRGIEELGVVGDWPHSKLQKFVAKFDANKDDHLDFDEFCELAKGVCKKNKKEIARAAAAADAAALIAAEQAEAAVEREDYEVDEEPAPPLGTQFSGKTAKIIFGRMDLDNSGTLDFGELWTGAKDLGITERWPTEELEAFIRGFDADQDGALTYDEFKALCKAICKENRKVVAAEAAAAEATAQAAVEAAAKAAAAEEVEVSGDVPPSEIGTKFSTENATAIFTKLDADNSGTVTDEELESGILELGLADHWSMAKLFKIIDKHDVDRDGALNLDEFLNVCRVVAKKNLKYEVAAAAAAEAKALQAAQDAAEAVANDDVEIKDQTTLGTKYNATVAKAIFKRMDTLGAGSLPHAGLARGLKEIGLVDGWSEKKMIMFIEKVDANGDGSMDFEEFKVLCKSVCKFNRKIAAETAQREEAAAHEAAVAMAAVAATDENLEVEGELEIPGTGGQLMLQYSTTKAKEVFDAIDSEGTGAISKEQLHFGIKELGIAGQWSFKKLDGFLNEFDANNDDSMDFEEFKGLCKAIVKSNRKKAAKMAKLQEAEAVVKAADTRAEATAGDEDLDVTLGTAYSAKNAKIVFERVDADSSGTLSYEELSISFGELGLTGIWSDDDVKKFLVQYDVNGDGELDFKEFKTMCKAIAKINRERAAAEAKAAAEAARAKAAAAQKRVDDAAVAKLAEIQAEREMLAQQQMAGLAGGKRIKAGTNQNVGAEVVFMDVGASYEELKYQNEAQRALRRTAKFDKGRRSVVREDQLPEEDFSKLASRIADKKRRNSATNGSPEKARGTSSR